MGSIRPLFTITVLVVVGVFLYVNINKGPVTPRAHSHDGRDHAEDGVPPLAAAGGGATLAQDTSAPAWPSVDSKSAPAMPPLASTPALPAANGAATSAPALNITTSDPGAAKNALPVVPPIPELPEMPQTADAATGGGQPATQPGALPSLELPKNVPMAQYDNDGGPSLGSGASTDTPGALPALPAFPAETTNTTTPLAPPTGLATPANSTAAGAANNPLRAAPNSDAGTTVPTSLTPSAPSAADRYGNPVGSSAAVGAPSTPATPAIDAPPPSPPTIPAIPAGVQIPDRYGVGASVTPQPPAVSPLAGGPNAAAGASFAASWPAIQSALEKRDLKQAHQLLSKWHGDETLSPADTQRVETLLGQLAGTVIYSTEHQLEPARVVKPGETLESIAKEYNVSWQLLAKINGVPAPDQVRPGQELKVVRGPFSAVVDLRRSEMTLEVGGCYAGTFAITPPSDAASSTGEWMVTGPVSGLGQAGDRALVLQRTERSGVPGQSIVLGAVTAETVQKIGVPSQRLVALSAQDAEDVSDILSVGSRVTVRR